MHVIVGAYYSGGDGMSMRLREINRCRLSRTYLNIIRINSIINLSGDQSIFAVDASSNPFRLFVMLVLLIIYV